MKIIIKQLLILTIFIFLIYGCAANTENQEAERSDPMEEDIDGLFGISEEDASASQADDEAEVLRLLGISKEEAAATTEEPVPEESEEELNTEISNLEQKLNQKEIEISNLKSEIAIKDQKIYELEASIENGVEKEPYSGPSGFRQEYDRALNQYNNRNYKSAISMFETLLSRDYNNSLSDNCQYWIGESYYGLGNFNQAIVEFTKVFSFNKSNKFDDAQLKLGLCYWRLGDKQKAREELERLISDYPKSEYINKAQQFLAKF